MGSLRMWSRMSLVSAGVGGCGGEATSSMKRKKKFGVVGVGWSGETTGKQETHAVRPGQRSSRVRETMEPDLGYDEKDSQCHTCQNQKKARDQTSEFYGER